MPNDAHSRAVVDSEDYFGLLDAVVVVAEAWRMLVVASVIAAIAAFGYAQLQPKLYESHAVLSLNAAQLARFSSPDFLARSGVEEAVWKVDLSHVSTGSATEARSATDSVGTFDVSLRANSSLGARSELTSLIEVFKAETALDLSRRELLESSRVRILKALENLELIGSKLAAEIDNTLPGSESELYSRSVIMLLDEQKRREDDLLSIEAELGSAKDIVVTAPSLPAAPLPHSPRATIIAGVGGAIFLVLCFAFGREALVRAGRTPAGSAKLKRLARAFRLRP